MDILVKAMEAYDKGRPLISSREFYQRVIFTLTGERGLIPIMPRQRAALIKEVIRRVQATYQDVDRENNTVTISWAGDDNDEM